MKTIQCAFATVLSIAFLAPTNAQVSVNVNIGAPPVWAPIGHAEVGFYFLPEIDTYYDVRESNFIYLNRGRWIRSRQLPPHCASYDLYHGRTVFLSDYHGHHPYYNFKHHKTRYYASSYAPRRIHYARPVARHYVVRDKHHAHYRNDHHKQNHGGGHGNGRGNGHHKRGRD